MNWLSQGTVNGLAASVAEHEVAVERAHEELENHRRAAFQVMEVLHRHQGLAAEAKFLLTIAHGAAPIPSPGEIREVAGEEEGLGLAIGSIRMALPADASAAQFGHLAESMRALYAAAHVVALHADERARTGAPPPRMPEQDVPVGVPRAFASLLGRQVRVDNADGTREIGLLSSVEGGQLTLLDEDGVPSAWPLLDEVLAVRAWPPAGEPDPRDAPEPDTALPDTALPDTDPQTPAMQDAPMRDAEPPDGDALDAPGQQTSVQQPPGQQPPDHQAPQREPARVQSRAGGVVSLVRRSGRSKSAAGT